MSSLKTSITDTTIGKEGTDMKTFYVLWELTFPATIIVILLYVVFALSMYQYLQVGSFRQGFKQGGVLRKLEHIVMFILYLPVYVLLVIIGVY